MQDKTQDNLDPNLKDRGVSIVNAALGLVPGGSILAEIVTQTVKGQQTDRVIDYIRRLDKRVEVLEKSEVKARTANEDFRDLHVKACQCALTLKSDHRRERLAAFMFRRLQHDEIHADRSQRLLALYSSLNDSEYVILKAYWNREDRSYWELHRDLIYTPSALAQASDEERFAKAISESYYASLVEKRLLAVRFRSIKRKPALEQKDIDMTTGMPHAAGHEITDLGNLLISEFDLA